MDKLHNLPASPLGFRESAICEATRRIRARIERDSVLRQQVETIKAGLKT